MTTYSTQCKNLVKTILKVLEKKDLLKGEVEVEDLLVELGFEAKPKKAPAKKVTVKPDVDDSDEEKPKKKGGRKKKESKDDESESESESAKEKKGKKPKKTPATQPDVPEIVNKVATKPVAWKPDDEKLLEKIRKFAKVEKILIGEGGPWNNLIFYRTDTAKTVILGYEKDGVFGPVPADLKKRIAKDKPEWILEEYREDREGRKSDKKSEAIIDAESSSDSDSESDKPTEIQRKTDSKVPSKPSLEDS